MPDRKKVIKYKSIYVAKTKKNDINNNTCEKTVFSLQTKDSFEGIDISLKNHKVVRNIYHTILRIGNILSDNKYKPHNFIIYLKK